MAIDLDQVTSMREELDEFITERDVVRERASAARAAKVAAETYVASTDKVATLVPDSIPLPPFPEDEYLKWLDEASKATSEKPSDDITKLVGKLTNYVAVAEELGIPGDEAVKIATTLSRFQASAPKSGGGSTSNGDSPSARSRNLKSPMSIVILDPIGNEVKRVGSGTRSDGADWGTAQDQINVAFKTLDPAGYAAIKPELRTVRDLLLQVDSEGGNVDETVTSPGGYSVHVLYPAA